MEQNFDTTGAEAMISVDTKSGLELFAEHVDQLREEIELFQTEFFNRHEAIPPEFYTAGELYQTLRALVLEALDQLFTSDRVADEVVDSLQISYNELSAVRDAFSLLIVVGEEVQEVVELVAAAEGEVSPAVETAIPSPFYVVSEAAGESPQKQPPLKSESSKQNFATHAKKSDTIFTKRPEVERPLDLLTAEILANPKYQKVIEHYFGSPALFEASLLREIFKREQPSKLDTFLGVIHESVYHGFLKDLPLTEIVMLQEESFTAMRERVSALNVDYSIYVEWMKDLPLMEHLVRPHAAMTFSDLYVRAELEILWDQFQNQ